MKTLEFKDKVSLGVARVEITHVGYESYRGFLISECEIVDKLYAKVQVWSDGLNEAIWIGLDECSLRNISANALLDSLSERTGVHKDFLLLFCVHNHSGHNYRSLDLEKFGRILFEGVQQARKASVPIKYLKQTIGINNNLINRRHFVDEQDGGVCIMFNDGCVVDQEKNKLEISGQLKNAFKGWGNQKEVADAVYLNGDVDNRIHMWEFLDENKNTVATNVRVNAHPVTMSQSRVGKKISGDYVHKLEEMIEESRGGICSVMNGSFGDSRPLHQEYSLSARDQIAMDYFEALANGVSHQESMEAFSLHNHESIEFSLRNHGEWQDRGRIEAKLKEIDENINATTESKKRYFDQKEFLGALMLGFNGQPNAILTEKEMQDGHIRFNLAYWKIGPMQILALPGEPLIKLSREIEKTNGFLPIGLSNGYMSYMPHPEEITQGGYEMNQNMLSKESLEKIAFGEF